ncbi:Uncharacterised protein [Aeromonas encheleia]|nr:Uncharacterised protein [Aeromonas encheleia]
MSEPVACGHEGMKMTLAAINLTITNTESES